ncbi:MAG: DUF91 domain-containing protein [SAR324 cluster bacterium]|nr:DUF91 domain-containing protein [SAR324 cluster bacterium]
MLRPPTPEKPPPTRPDRSDSPGMPGGALLLGAIDPPPRDSERSRTRSKPSDDSSEFAYERDLRNYLSKNLGLLEPGLKVYQDEGLTGIEFSVGGRYIDILAIDSEKNFVVIELKVSRGYDRTIGQILRYMAWVEKHMSDGKYVRGFIVAKDITEDLKLAASRISDISLVEYEIKFNLKRL